MFTDVPANDPFRPFIEELYNDGITAGCLANPLMYCPNASVTRAQMAVFLLKAVHGSGYRPFPSPSGMFSDLDPADPFTPFIEQLYNEGITGGCSVNPLRYCPNDSVTRGQMAAFLVRTFNIPLP